MIEKLRERRLQVYSTDRGQIKEDYGIEEVVLAGGYGYRQVLELIQNGADAILEAVEAGMDPGSPPRIEVVLTDSHLYVANTGAPFSNEGVEALLRSHSSPKRGNQIGRFGLGFKSLLGLDGTIDITSGRFAFRMDPARCRQELRTQFKVRQAPGLRLAWQLDMVSRSQLQKKFPWATTVVCAEIKKPRMVKQLRKEILQFPSEFLLFLPVSVEITLDHGGKEGSKLIFKREEAGKDLILHEGESASRWRKVEKLVKVTSETALADATHTHAREQVPLAWAIPLDANKADRGQFWAFFPTQTPTYIMGILNAPWKLNSDRNSIIEGDWNSMLMEEAAKLVAKSIFKIASSKDPARTLDAFPRKPDRKGEIASPLINGIWSRLENEKIIPDATGKLQYAKKLRRHPLGKMELAVKWAKIANKSGLAKLVHPYCLKGHRFGRLKDLAERLKDEYSEDEDQPLAPVSESYWFKSIASITKDQAIKVLKIAEEYRDEYPSYDWFRIARGLKVIPGYKGKLLTSKEAIFAPDVASIPQVKTPVAPWVLKDESIKELLIDVFGVSTWDDDDWEGLLNVESPGRDSSAAKWDRFWGLLRAAPKSAIEEVVGSRIFVKRRDGNWVSNEEVLLPGSIVSESDTDNNKSVLLDMDYHKDDEFILEKIGLIEEPEGLIYFNDYNSSVLGDWLWFWRREFFKIISGNPSWRLIKPHRCRMPVCWEMLGLLSGKPNARLTRVMLNLLLTNEISKTIKLGHSSRNDYPVIDISNPINWLLLQHGSVIVGNRTVDLAALVAKADESMLDNLPEWEEIHNYIELLRDVSPSIEPTKSQIRKFWHSIIAALYQDADEEFLRQLWDAAAADDVVPKFLNKSKDPTYITNSTRLAMLARSFGIKAFSLNKGTQTLWLKSGARKLAGLVKPNWEDSIGEIGLLSDVVPEVKRVLVKKVRDSLFCRNVNNLELIIKGNQGKVPCLLWGKELLLDIEQFSSMPRPEGLRRIIEEVFSKGWIKGSVSEAMEVLGDKMVHDRRQYVLGGKTLAERALRAVGNKREPLLEAMGDLAKLDILEDCPDVELAELALSQIGPGILSSIRTSMEEEGLKPPKMLSSKAGWDFVRSIGFPEVFAVAPSSKREAEEHIQGPLSLPPLHDFQEEVLGGIKALVGRGVGRRRAVVNLPTGGGKTRVTVQAAVELILRPEGTQRFVIWVAQSDELCEQAVQAFRQVWMNRGAQGTPLRIIRLWGGHGNPVIHDPEKPVVVVASIQTLNTRMANIGLEVLQEPKMLVVDECHHAIATSYTHLLSFLNADSRKPSTAIDNEPVILGLSATPFRKSDQESERLAKRFDGIWFPSDQSGLHTRLRRSGVLSEIDNSVLDTNVELTVDEKNELESYINQKEWFKAEHLMERINRRFASIAHRNQKILDFISESDERSILLFANSVYHAKEMAARLNHNNIPSAAISGETPKSTRRYFLSRFQEGKIRVLCNHSLLSTGFDAPKTDMVLISRVVFSAVRYMQMVGRGMRGVKNGGTERCRVVTVMDNFQQFQDSHPYHYCQEYFTGSLDD